MRWSFLFKVLVKFGFHTSIIDRFAALYINQLPESKLMATNSFILETGTRLIFTLSQWIRERSDILGVPLSSGEKQLALLEDDVLVTLIQPTQTLVIHENAEGLWFTFRIRNKH